MSTYSEQIYDEMTVDLRARVAELELRVEVLVAAKTKAEARIAEAVVWIYRSNSAAALEVLEQKSVPSVSEEPSVLAGNGALFERCRIVSWLRDKAEQNEAGVILEILAEQIDAGEHMTDEPTPTGSTGRG